MLASKPPGRVLISVFQIDLGHIAFHDHLRSKRTRGVRQPLENVTGLIACRQLRQAASLKEQIVRVFVLKVGLPLANLVQRDRLERNRLEIFPLKFDMGDNTFPKDRLIELNIHRRYIKDEVAEVVKDWPLVINLHAVYQGHTMHHDNVGAGVDLFMSPFLEPIRRS